MIHKIRFPKYNLPECIPACKLNPLKISHLLSNPHVLPCGNLACLDCIYDNYNPVKQLLKCEICRSEHKLQPEWQPLNQSLFSDLLNKSVLTNMMKYNQKIISDLCKNSSFY